jgi:hypothetical protein
MGMVVFLTLVVGSAVLVLVVAGNDTEAEEDQDVTVLLASDDVHGDDRADHPCVVTTND